MNECKKPISVIVPMFNVEGLISETILSLKKNELDIEFILIDDGSNDSTVEIAKKSIGNDQRFLICRQENSGVSAARNHGLRKASGEYICFVDADDLVAPNALDNLFRAAKKNNADFVYGAVKKFNKNREWFIDAHVRNNLFSGGLKLLSKNTELLFFIGVAGKIIHRKLIENIYFPEGVKFSEDTVLMVKAFSRAKRIYTISDVVYYYRERDLTQHEASATQNKKHLAVEYLSNVCGSMLLCKEDISSNSDLDENEKNIILRKYYDRMFAYEFWPLFINSLKFDKKNSRTTLSLVINFLDKHTSEEINKIPAIRFYFIKVFVDQIFRIKVRDFFLVREILQKIIFRLEDKVKEICAKPEFYGRKWADAIALIAGNVSCSFFNFLKLKIRKYFNFLLRKNENKIFGIAFNLFKLLPVDEKKIVFATHKIKPLSENLNGVLNRISKKDFKVFKFLGYSKSFWVNLKRNYHYATASAIILEDYHKPIYGYSFKKKTKIVQLWHAAGAFKKFGNSAIGLADSNSPELEKNAHFSYTDVFVSSPGVTHIYAEAFGIAVNNVKSLGVPRTDIFFEKKYLQEISKKVSKKFPKDKINVLYAPTFRGTPAQRANFSLDIDWLNIDENFFDSHRLIIKLHPVVKNKYNLPPEKFKNKVFFVEDTFTTSDLMIHCDILVTDYSSIIFEYALMDKPIIYYAYDLDNYYNERGFYYPFDKYVYGDVCKSSAELFEKIVKINPKKNLVNFREKRQWFINEFMISCDGESTNRVADEIIAGLGRISK